MTILNGLTATLLGGLTSMVSSTVGFSPSQQAGLLAWGRADQGITLNGSNVSAWNDLTPHGNNMAQATAANQPLFVASGSINSLPCVRSVNTVTPTLTWLIGSLSSTYTGSALTLLCVATVKAQVNGRVISTQQAATADYHNLTSAILYTPDTAHLGIYRNLVTVSGVVASMATGLSGVYSLRFDGALGTVRLSGTDVVSGGYSGAFGIDHFYLGAGFDTSTNNANVEPQQDTYEWAIIDHALSVAELAQWNTYTTARYGLAT